MKKTFLIIGIFLILGSVGWYGYNRSTQAEEKPLQTAPVEFGNLKIAFSIDGKTSIERRDLKYTVSGKVAHIAVQEGQEVQKGQYLMALDTQDVQKNLERDLKDYLIARNTFDQTAQVTYPNGALTDTIKRTLENSQYSLDKSVLDVEIKNVALRESYLYAPIEGIVSAIAIKEGEATNTQNGGVVLTITKPGSLTFEAFAEDTEALKIKKEQTSVITLDAIPGILFPSEINFISNLATIDQNGISSYKIRLTITDTKGYELLDGMSGSVQFITKQKTGVLSIPNGAVYRNNSQSFARVLNGSNTEERNIVTGFTDGKRVEIVSGLKKGDIVILP